MGNATTKLQTTNESACGVSVIIDVPLKKSWQPINARLAPGQHATFAVQREVPGKVKADVYLTFDNGQVYYLRFGVVDHDCEVGFYSAATKKKNKKKKKTKKKKKKRRRRRRKKRTGTTVCAPAKRRRPNNNIILCLYAPSPRALAP